MMRLSFIVPFYNVELYIEQCIRSLYNQDISKEEYEVICVDDCSPDGSRSIVERLQKEYPTLRLLTHKENKRQGGARNTGLREAKGKYIWFVDSDDYVIPNVLKYILNVMDEYNLQILQFAYQYGINTILDNNINTNIQTGEDYLFENADQRTLVNKIIGPWRQIYLCSFLSTNKFVYIENAQYEDTDFVLKTFIAAERVSAIDTIVYIYRKNENSTTTTTSVNPLKIAWQVNQYARCADLIECISSLKGRMALAKMIYNSLFVLRKDVQKLSNKQKYIYIKHIYSHMSKLHTLVTWRTWLAIRYGITWFI